MRSSLRRDPRQAARRRYLFSNWKSALRLLSPVMSLCSNEKTATCFQTAQRKVVQFGIVCICPSVRSWPKHKLLRSHLPITWVNIESGQLGGSIDYKHIRSCRGKSFMSFTKVWHSSSLIRRTMVITVYFLITETAQFIFSTECYVYQRLGVNKCNSDHLYRNTKLYTIPYFWHNN